MAKKFLITNILISIILTFVVSSASFSIVGAAPVDDACSGVAIAGGNCVDPANQTKVDSTVADVVNVLSVVVGVAATIMITVGGFRYVVSRGDSNAVNSAKNTILYAIVGLVIVIFAQIIVRFVINKL